MKSEFLTAFNQICAERNLPRDVVLEAIRSALVSAYRRNANAPAGQNITAEIDPETGEASIYVEQQVVAEVTEPQTEITLKKARKFEPQIELGERLMVERTPRNFGRIAAQTARQVILQRIREAEREAQFSHYVEQEGELVYGTVQNVNSQFVTLQLGRTEAVMPRKEQVPGERYSVHDRIRAYVLEVRRTTRGPHIIVSRSHKKMLRRLLELEVPEIANGTVEIKAIAREAGSRSKIAVVARQTGVDPVGACVGMRGMRIQSIVKELGGEKVDVIEWSPDSVTFIAKSLSPARVLSVQLDEDPDEGRTANVVVPDDQLSLAIGRAGQNARLAAKLTNWRIDIQGATEAIEWVLKKVNEDHALLEALGPTTERLPTVAAALRHHKEEKMPYTAEELMAIREAIEGVRGYYISLRDAERARLVRQEVARKAALSEARTARQAAIEEARARIASTAYQVPLSDIELSNRVLGHLERSGLENVGQVLEHMAEGDEGLLKLEGIGPKSMNEIQEALDKLELPEEEPLEAEAEEAEAIVVEEAEAAVIEEAEAVVLEEAEVATVMEEIVEAVETVEAEELAAAEEEEPAVVAEEVETAAAEVVEEGVEERIEPVAEEVVAEEPVIEEAPKAEEEVSEVEEQELADEEQALEEEEEEEELPEDWEKFAVEEEEEEEEEEGELLDSKARQRKRRKRKLVYDEELGEVISIRRHWRDEEEDWDRYLR